MRSDHTSYLRPGPLFTRVLNPLMIRTGAVTTLAVRGRTSGAWRTTPVQVLKLRGVRYLVSPRGESQWVRNLRAAGGGRLQRRSHAVDFVALELAPSERPPVIRAYLRRYGWFPPVWAQFKALPEPSQHPVFRITP